VKFYLAGPMRGYPCFNFPAFREATKVLRDYGYEIVSPHELDEEAGYYWEGFTGHEDLSEYNFDIAERLLEDIKVIADKATTGVIVMQGWSSSSGARAEASFAWGIGKPVLRLFRASPYNCLVGLAKGDIAPKEIKNGMTTWTDGDRHV
jgi:hypothetical protein